MRISDWSSDVCSSDLLVGIVRMVEARVLVVDDEFLPLAETLRAEAGCIEHVVLMSDHAAPAGLIDYEAAIARADAAPDAMRGGDDIARSEERRVGKEGGSTCRSRGSPYD